MLQMPSPISLGSPVNVGEPAAIDLGSIAAQDEKQVADLWKLSDVSVAAARSIRQQWHTVPVNDRQRLIARLVQLVEASIDANFMRIFRIALEDEDPVVRSLAIEGLWEDEDPSFIPVYSDVLTNDPDADVRAGAAEALRPHLQRMIQEEVDISYIVGTLLAIASEPRSSPLLRRRCVETAGVAGDDPRVQQLIRESFSDDDQTIVAGAIRAMGLSSDPKWLDTIEREMDSEDAELRFESAGAAGMIGDSRMIPGLSALALDSDTEVRSAAVAALGQIGGPPALRVLRNLLNEEDGLDVDAVQAAITEAELIEDPIADLN